MPPTPPWNPWLDRRRLLIGGAATAAGLSLPLLSARAAVLPADRRFLFVYTLGGWDPTRVFADLLSSTSVDTEEDAEVATVGNMTFVDHPQRPSVRAFYEAYHSEMIVINGVYISSLAHSSATRLSLTGTVDAANGDWGTRLAAHRAEEFILPYLVIGGASFSGPYGVYVGRAGSDNQFSGLAVGDIMERSDIAVQVPEQAQIGAIDDYLASLGAARSAAAIGAQKAGLYDSFRESIERAGKIKALSDEMDLGTDGTFDSQVELAVRVLSMGLSRCAAVNHPSSRDLNAWDSHSLNDSVQLSLFEDLFSRLSVLMETLRSTPGNSAPTLADETVIVVMSEMGRTPTLNGSNGKDHWPYTTVMLVGGGIEGDRIIGGFDERQIGLPVDAASGELDDNGNSIGANVIGATLLALGDVDPLEEGVSADPLGPVVG